LKTVRKARGLSQEAFSDVSSRTYMSSLERDLKSPTLNKLAELCEVMEVHPAHAADAGLRGQEPAAGRAASGAGAAGAGGGVEDKRRGVS
jgi:transcriptional regulator with XRE-family HTH domain